MVQSYKMTYFKPYASSSLVFKSGIIWEAIRSYDSSKGIYCLPKSLYSLNMLTYMANQTLYVIKLKILSWGDYSGLIYILDGPNYNHRVLIGEGRRQRARKWNVMIEAERERRVGGREKEGMNLKMPHCWFWKVSGRP